MFDYHHKNSKLCFAVIKTNLRNKIDDEWLNDTMECYIELEMFAKIDKEIILQRFQNMQNHRIQLTFVIISAIFILYFKVLYVLYYFKFIINKNFIN